MRSKKLLLNISSSLILQIVALICGFIVPKLIITSFGSDVNGLVSSITQFLAYITLLESGIGPVVTAALYKPIASKDKQTIQNILKSAEKFFRVIALIFLVYLVVLAFVYPMIVSEQFSFIYTMSLVVIISISTFAEYFFGMTYKLYIQANQKTYITSFMQIIVYILNTITIVLLIKFGAKIHIVKLMSGIIFVLRPIAQNIYVRKKYKIDLNKAQKDYKLEQKWDGLAQHIAAVIHNNTDVTILTFFTKITEVSVYSVYALVVNGIKAIVRAFASGLDASFGDMIAKNEKEQLRKSFNSYQFMYYTITTVVYSCAFLLITPFVKVYTAGVKDVNYIRPLFGYFIVLSEFLWSIRLPYSSLTLAAGHFKQTRKGAWVEAISNILISIVLVWKFGIVGVAIGTAVAMTIRTAEFIYHTSKHILDNSIWLSVKKVAIIAVEVILIAIIVNMIPDVEIVSYISWILQAMITFSVALIVVLGINILAFRDEAKTLLNTAKNIIRRK